jgi:hypothetical protein
MAIELKDVQHTQQSVLARFQQRLGDPPSPLDILIINQIGCMLISNLVRTILLIEKKKIIYFSHKQLMKKLFDYLLK